MDIVCAILSSLVLVYAVMLFAKRGRKNMDYIFICVIISCFLSYFPTYIRSYSLGNAVLSDFINILQIITLNSCTFETLQSTIPHEGYFYWIILLRAIGHISLPLLTLVVAYNAIKKNIAHLKFYAMKKNKKNIYAFSALNDNSEMVANDILEHDEKALVIFYECDHAEERFYNSNDNKQKRIVSVDKKMTRSEIKLDHRQNLYYFCIDDNRQKNVNDSLCLMNATTVPAKIKRLKSKEEAKRYYQRIHICIFSDNPDNDAKILDVTERNGIDFKLVNRHQISANYLFREHPLYSVLEQGKKNQKLNVLMVGTGSMGQELMETILWVSQLPDVSLTMHVVSEHKEKLISYLKMYKPEMLLKEYDLRFYEADPDSADFEEILKQYCPDVNYACICRDSDEKNLTTGIWLRRFYLRNDHKYADKNKPLIALYIKDDNMCNAIEKMSSDQRNGYSLIPFGNNKKIFCYSELIDSKLDKLAKNMHMAYDMIYQRQQYEKGNQKEKPCVNVTEQLQAFNSSETAKRSNHAAALHINYKLWWLGFEEVKPSNSAEMNNDSLRTFIQNHPDEIRKLAIAEHDRWVAFHRTEGWRSISLEDAQTEGYGRLSNGSKKSVMLQMHPDICPFEEISARSKALHRDDTTEFDEQLIRSLPEILEDSWNVSDQKYYVRGYQEDLEEKA